MRTKRHMAIEIEELKTRNEKLERRNQDLVNTIERLREQFSSQAHDLASYREAVRLHKEKSATYQKESEHWKEKYLEQLAANLTLADRLKGE